MTGSQLELILVDQQERGICRLAEPTGVLDQRIQYRLQICRGTRNNLENLAGGSLLLQRLAHLRVSLREGLVLLLQFREQPHVLDGDYGLVGEGRQQGDLSLGERIDGGAADDDDADCE